MKCLDSTLEGVECGGTLIPYGVGSDARTERWMDTSLGGSATSCWGLVGGTVLACSL